MTDPQTEPKPEESTDEPVTPASTAAAEPEETGEPAVAASEDEDTEEPAAEPSEAESEEAAEPAAAAKPAARTKKQRKSPQRAPVEPRPLSPYAIIETGGKQYRVSVGDRISVERLRAEAGSDITIDRVLLLGGDGSTRVGTPVVDGAAVTARVDDHFRGEKIVVFKYKPKKRYRRRQGHRQSLTRLTITDITG